VTAAWQWPQITQPPNSFRITDQNALGKHVSNSATPFCQSGSSIVTANCFGFERGLPLRCGTVSM
jgi:hypothetical protein